MLHFTNGIILVKEMIYKNVEIHNGYDIVRDDNGVELITRVPENVRKKMSPIGSKYGAYNTVGVEFRFLLKSEEASIHIDIIYPDQELKEDKNFRVYWGNFQSDTVVAIGERNHTITIKKPTNLSAVKALSQKYQLSFDPEVVRIIASHECHCMITKVEGEVEIPTREMYPKKRWLAYGSSITQGSNLWSYTSFVAQKLGLDLYNLGFGGSAILEPEMADFIATKQDMDIISMEMGINMIWDIEHDCLGDENFFKERVDYFIPTIAKAHMDKPIFCIDIFAQRDDFEEGEMTQTQRYREIVREKVKELNMKHLIYIDGSKMIESLPGVSVDLLHPSLLGCQEIARNLSKIMGKYVS